MNGTSDSMNLLFSVSQRYLGSFVCSLRSIVLHGGYAHYDVYILHSCFDEEMMAAIHRDFSQSVTFHFIRVEEEMMENFPADNRYSQETYYRFLAPFLLTQELERILYLDADTVVINPLRELYETPFDDNAIVGCAQTRELLSKVNQTRQQSGKAVLHLNPGVLLMNLPYLRSHFTLIDVINCAYRKKTNIVSPDQFVLTVLCGNQVKLVDTMRYNLTEQLLAAYNAEHKRCPVDLEWIRKYGVIIHYSGYPKPGNAGYTGAFKPFYDELMEASRCR